MKKRILIAAVFLLPSLWEGAGMGFLFSQTPGEWTWMHGDNIPNSAGNFGVQGIPSPANKPPSLYEPCEWTDNNGNFWLFGGLTNANSFTAYAALWKFDPSTNQWTWMKGPSVLNQPGIYGIQGVPSPVNYPRARSWGALTWVDASGNLWLFGGSFAGNANNLNDLWKYDIAANEWTWMNGPNTMNNPGSYGVQGVPSPANLPPSRSETSCSWTDNAGNLWLYGGFSNMIGYCGDLWKYDIPTNEWTWMHGANTGPVYGVQGVAASANTPGGRYVYASWTDLAGNLWLFGGAVAATNDLWKYNIATNQWTWMKGSSTFNDPGNYGTKCVSATTNIPRSRMENRARVRDVCGNFWNFGGWRPSDGSLNDLWHYNISTNQWTWVSGDNTTNQTAVYGTKGLSSPANKPGGKYGSVAWMDNSGYIWVFGGMEGGVNNSTTNDLFRYVPCPCTSPSLCSCSTSLSATATTSNVLCNGQCTGAATVTPTGGTNPFTYNWSNMQITQTATGLCAGNYTVTVADANSTTITQTVTITQPTAITATTSSTFAPSGTATVAPLGGTLPYTYLWNTTSPQTTQTATGLAAGLYCCTVTDANNCTKTFCVTVNSEPLDCSNVGELYVPNAFSPNGDGENDVLKIYYGNYACIKTVELVIYNRWGEEVFKTTSISDAWDGKYEGETIHTEVLVYYLNATMIDGKEIIRKGNISLVK